MKKPETEVLEIPLSPAEEALLQAKQELRNALMGQAEAMTRPLLQRANRAMGEAYQAIVEGEHARQLAEGDVTWRDGVLTCVVVVKEGDSGPPADTNEGGAPCPDQSESAPGDDEGFGGAGAASQEGGAA